MRIRRSSVAGRPLAARVPFPLLVASLATLLFLVLLVLVALGR